MGHIDATPLEAAGRIRDAGHHGRTGCRNEGWWVEATEDRSTTMEPTEYFNERTCCRFAANSTARSLSIRRTAESPGTPQFKQWQVKARAAVVNAVDGPEQRPTSERCLGNPAAQPPNLYNPGTNLHQIVQTKDAVVFLAEVMGFVRIIRLDARHAPAAVTSWTGDSIGWWEGDTLVVQTRSFSPSDIGRVAAGITFLVSPGATVTERITRVSDAELNYVFTVDDPSALHAAVDRRDPLHAHRTIACSSPRVTKRTTRCGSSCKAVARDDAESTSIRPSK